MPPPSQLAIATSSLQRLVKEETSYHKELEQQQARLKSLEDNPDDDENAEFQLKQQNRAIAETRAVFPPLRQRIAAAAQKLGDLLASSQESGAVEASTEESAKATVVLEGARKALALSEGE